MQIKIRHGCEDAYKNPDKSYYLDPGKTYFVYGITSVLDKTDVPRYLIVQEEFLWPLGVVANNFDIIDPSIDPRWIICKHDDGINISYPEIASIPYFIERVADYEPEVFAAWEKIKSQT